MQPEQISAVAHQMLRDHGAEAETLALQYAELFGPINLNERQAWLTVAALIHESRALNDKDGDKKTASGV